jgi:hypothetical protein
MSKLDDLLTLQRLLKEFEFPVSPILEYAIKEKIDQLSSDDDSQLNMPIMDVQENHGMMEVSVEASVRIKKNATKICVIRADGTTIVSEKAASTFCQVIKEIGVEKVYALKIPMDGMYLVTIGGNPQYPSAQHDVGGGYFVNVHSNTKTKKCQLERIFSVLNLNWKVEVNGSN